MADVNGKSVIITGAASGVGRVGASVFALAGAQLILVDQDEAGLKRVQNDLLETAPEVRVQRADVRQPEDWQRVIALARDAYGRVDVLWNNAGITGPGAIVGEYPLSTWERVIAVNLTGVFLGMQAVLATMVAQGSGAIVNTSSIAAQVAFTGDAAYCASKAGVLMLTKTAAAEYARDGIRINCVLPGIIDTPMLGQLEQVKARAAKLTPLGRLGDPAEIARCALFLASDEASFMTGAAVVADGGYTLR
jgi:NAD(P)-dependent dehydrogenase (short-subunit alcohol dehydrogenase family)